MAENWKNCFEEELICPICLHVFSEPVQLPCKHNFCRACISEAWAKDAGLVRCPECNHAYNQKPSLEKNHKLSNIVEKFNALNVEKTPAVLQCILCRRGPPLPAQKVCLRCKAPCCQSHVQTHLQQPSSNQGHLLVEAEDVKAWSCPQHDEYRLYHCEAEQVAVCQYCCISRCAAGHHAVTDVEVRRNDIRQMLMKQQDRIEERTQDIEEQLCKLESDKCLVEDKLQQLQDEVRLQYQKMHQLLEEDMAKTLEALDKARSRFCQENSAQALQLNERRQEAKKLLGSVQVVFDKAEDINFMKNTKSVKILMDRTQACVGNTLPPHKVGHLNSKIFLSEISKKEKNLRKMLEVPFSAPANFLQSIPAYSCSLSGLGAEKRKHSSAFPEGGTAAPSSAAASGFLESPSGGPAKKPYLGPGAASGEPSQSSQAMAPCSSAQHMVGLGGGAGSMQAVAHTGSVFTPSHYPGSGQYGSRKILMCTMDNCYCSGVPSVSNHRAHPPYPRTGSFPWTVSSQEYPHPLPSATSMPQSLQGISVRDWLDASQGHRHPDLYGLYGQSSTKHYVTS